MIHYAAIAPDGSVIGVERTAEEAAELAAAAVPDMPVAVQHLGEGNADLLPNAMPTRELPAHAADLTGLPQIKQSAITMKLSEAHDRLLPYFAGLVKRGEPTTAYLKPLHMADAWIGQNYKTKKKHPGRPAENKRPAEVMGLTLVPAAHAYLAAHGEGPYARLWEGGDPVEGAAMLHRWKSEARPLGLDRKFTFCAGSSQDCRDSCLVFAGQNASERYNTYRKVAQTMALLREPEAFMRMLVESIERWLARIEGTGVQPFFRMNVLSDIPWELVAPWLFDYFKDLTFYDYSKVAGRMPRKRPENYDLTFSVSGMPQNRRWAEEEVHQIGRRIAVVFLGFKPKGQGWSPVKKKGPALVAEVPLPEMFWGLPVVDGDVSDVRPYDPAPACVGLRWKTPSGKRAGTVVDPTSSSFVTPTYIVSSSRSQLREHWGVTERENPSDNQWLICAVTPRYQPIETPMTQPG